MIDAMRILVVDDDADVRIGTARVLEKAGFSVDQAVDGEAALQAIRQQRPDLLLLDRIMPGLDGLEICRQIKQDPAYADISIILMSGVYTESSQQADGLDVGADGYIARPIANRELLARVQSQVRILSLSRALQAKVTELEIANAAVSESEQATRNLLEDAVKARDQISAVNQQLQHEIEERKLAERELLRLGTAIDQATDAVIITDREGGVQYVNPAFENVTGYSRQEVLGQTPRILKSGKQDAAFYQQMWASLAAGETWSGHIINKRKDGTLYEEDATISPVRDASRNIVNFVAVKRDVTHEIELEVQLREAQKMEAVGRLAGGVAHDFNNLLMGIMGYTELCQQNVEPDHPIREWLDEIIKGANRSAEITRQLLAFARKQIIAPRTLDLNDAVTGMLKLLRRLIGEDIKLTWRPGGGLPPVKLDPSQVDQVLANLCINARDAIAGVGEITLQTTRTTVGKAFCATHPEATPGTYACLAVSDDGSGMDQETLAQIFEPFFTTKGLGEGTGLGLATVYGIVKQNNGFIDASSEPGKGTTFRIYLPQVAAEAETATVADKPKAPNGHGETILVAEDEKSLRVTCGLYLKALGYEILTAESPGQALKLAEAHPGEIQVLLTDVIMPGMNGRQLAQHISAIKPGVKVLFMSGYTADVIAKRGVLDEGVQFLSKPFTRDDLAHKLREVLQNASGPAFAPDKPDVSAPSENTAPGTST